MADPVLLWKKLRPFLRVNAGSFSKRKPFYRRDECGGTRSVIRWGGDVEESLMPDFREFCEWYELDPREGMSP